MKQCNLEIMKMYTSLVYKSKAKSLLKINQARPTDSRHATHHIINTDYIINTEHIIERNHLSASLQFLAWREGAQSSSSSNATCLSMSDV